jgi:hypothetical protein
MKDDALSIRIQGRKPSDNFSYLCFALYTRLSIIVSFPGAREAKIAHSS